MTSLIIGSIQGVTMQQFARLKTELEENFERVGWSNDTVFVKSERKHYPAANEVLKHLAETVPARTYGRLWYLGQKEGELFCAVIFIGAGRCEWKELLRHPSPAWWVAGVG